MFIFLVEAFKTETHHSGPQHSDLSAPLWFSVFTDSVSLVGMLAASHTHIQTHRHRWDFCDASDLIMRSKVSPINLTEWSMYFLIGSHSSLVWLVPMLIKMRRKKINALQYSDSKWLDVSKRPKFSFSLLIVKWKKTSQTRWNEGHEDKKCRCK